MSSAKAADRLRPRGSNQVGMRQFNERVVLQAIRLQGSCPKAEIARLTHLTAQTVQIALAQSIQPVDSGEPVSPFKP